MSLTNLSNEAIKKYSQRIILSRFRILNNNGFYGLLLMHMKFGLDANCDTAYTDGEVINFSPKFLDELSDRELDFVMMHEIMHVALKHCYRGKKADDFLFNVACDIVVNSNILYSNNMDINSITLKNYGESMHLIDKQEGYNFTAEEVYDKLIKNAQKQLKKSNSGSSKSSSKGTKSSNSGLQDDHSKWKEKSDDGTEEDEWAQKVVNAANAISRRESSSGIGKIPLGIERMIDELKEGKVDWKRLLNDFLSLEIGDYSFMPPDRRIEGPFYMPDFNELVESESEPNDILFMIDTSGSINNSCITQAYSEIKGALDQFPSLNGYLGFFDSNVYDPVEFSSVDDLLRIKPRGGGGTSFVKVFQYISKMENKPKSIIILTDGYALFPPESAAQNIPVIWLINNTKVTPPWGVVARMDIS